MKIATRLELDCTVADAWNQLDNPEVFLKVSKPFLFFTPMNPAVFPSRFVSGKSYTVKARAFGLVGLGTQQINPTMTEAGLKRTFVDNGRGLSGPLGLMKHFHHTMTLQPSDASSAVLTDELEWDAGLFTPLFYLGFRFFWWWRHRVMTQLVPSWRTV